MLLFNHSEVDFEGMCPYPTSQNFFEQGRVWGQLLLTGWIVKEGDRVAQLVLERVCLCFCGFVVARKWGWGVIADVWTDLHAGGG